MKKHILLSQVAYIHVEQRIKRKRMREIMLRPLNVRIKYLRAIRVRELANPIFILLAFRPFQTAGRHIVKNKNTARKKN